MAKVLIPVPSMDFDPTEAAVPWRILVAAGHDVRFATPSGRPGQADPRMITGEGLGPIKRTMMADDRGRAAYAEMERSEAFRKPASYADLNPEDYQCVMLPGGHAQGMREYLESRDLQRFVARYGRTGRPLAAVCHGVVLAAWSKDEATGRSVLHGRKTTALPRYFEQPAWLTGKLLGLGNYYRTYPETWVEEQVSAELASREDFVPGRKPAFSLFKGFARDTAERLDVGFTVRDRNYLSARWPGDAHRFGTELAAMLRE